ncbi:MAG TPA: FAD/NAD(P)-binding oxidoreductase [Ktedonobacteraceae bacterium]|jgi:sulfide:quinone oxidoreductase|nr:FAD/NAD(P)-binding oxidoreductase [Ktedonobacteraceae bacterium]
MPQHVVIVGGGVGGTIVANLLARALHSSEAEITLIDSTGKHVYMPGWLYLPFNQIEAESEQLVRAERGLLNSHVHLVTGDVQRIDARNHELHMRPPQEQHESGGSGGASEAVYPYDYLVLATGARLVPSDLPGLVEGEGKWHHFYSAEGALRLREALQAFHGGRIVITVGGIPYRCPPAPLEFTFLLDEWLHKQSLRNRTELHYLYPLPRVFPIESVAEVAAPLLEERHILSTVFFNAESVDTERKVISSLEGEEIPYDLLVLIPPHRGASVIEESGLGDEQGWVQTDRATLEVKGQPGIYALGDATDLPVSKSGSAAHFEAKVLAHRLIAEIRGEAAGHGETTYNGEVMCFLETGQNRATQLVFNYEHPPRPPRPSLYYHMEKQLFNWAYWHLVPPGLV